MEMSDRERNKNRLRQKIADIAFKDIVNPKLVKSNIEDVLDDAKAYHILVPYDILDKRIFKDTKNNINEIIILNRLDAIYSQIVNNRNNKNKRVYYSKVIQTFKIDIKDIFNQKRRYVKFTKEAQKNINEFRNEANKNLRKIKKNRKKIQKYKRKIKKYSYSSIISILGIFTAITFATFGGLQLLANVFGHIKEFDDFTIGNSIILGSVYIFSVYLILIILFNGISMLSNKKGYNFDINLNMYVLSSIVVIFIIGFMYAHFSLTHFWLSICLSGVGIVTILIIVSINFKCYKDNHLFN